MYELEHPLSISGREEKWTFRLLLALGLSAFGGLPFVPTPQIRLALALGGALFCILAFLRHRQIQRLRRWVTVTPKGFKIKDSGGERTFTDEGLICTSMAVKSNYTNGVLKSHTRTFSLWVEGESNAEQVVMINRMNPTEPDPLQRFMERCTTHLHAAAQAAIEAGERVEGEGWTLEEDELVVARGSRHDAYALCDLGAVDMIENHFCVWKRGGDQPIARIPAGSANAHLLGTLLRERILPDGDPASERAAESLGRVLFERKADGQTRLILWLAAVTALLGAVTCGIMATIPGQSMLFIAWGLLLFGAAGTFGYFGLKLRRTAFRCHVEGVTRITWRGEQRLRYTEVERFTYQAVRQFVHGAYVGTHLSLGFTPSLGNGKKPLKYRITVKNSDQELENLRTHISTVIAARMQQEFAAAGNVKWMPHLQFRSDGLEYRPFGIFARRAPIVIGYTEMSSHQFKDGYFLLWTRGRKKAVLAESTSQPNFFPGYVFLVNRMETFRRERVEAGAGHAG